MTGWVIGTSSLIPPLSSLPLVPCVCERVGVFCPGCVVSCLVSGLTYSAVSCRARCFGARVRSVSLVSFLVYVGSIYLKVVDESLTHSVRLCFGKEGCALSSSPDELRSVLLCTRCPILVTGGE